jgi:hypothetical protein
MAGSDEEAMNLPAEGKPQQSKPKVKTFACTGCGASVTLRNPESLSVVCDSCHSIIDAADENYRILQTYQGRLTFSPIIELGSRGELFGKKWELIGYLVREEVENHYSWEEYLLFNPYQGYRWLTFCSGHWSFVTPIKEKPDKQSNFARYKGKQYRIFDRGPVSNLFVLGEFYWRVVQDYRVTMEDYVCPPEMLSCEIDNNEINWSLGTYVEPEVIGKAFKFKPEEKCYKVGIAPNQVSGNTVLLEKSFKWWMLFLVILTATQVCQLCLASNHLSFFDLYSFIPNSKSASSTTTKVFTLEKDRANVAINVDAPVDNSWFYLAGEMVNNETGFTYPFDRSVEYYHGYDSDGDWTEGGTSSRLLIQQVPAGKYYIDFEYESGGFPGPVFSGVPGDQMDAVPRQFKISVFRDTPTYANYFWCLFFVSILPLWFWFMSRSDEKTRWSNSDYSPYQSSDDD